MRTKYIKILFYIGISCFLIATITHLMTFVPSIELEYMSCFWWLGVAVFIVFVPMITIAQQLYDKKYPFLFWQQLLAGTPKWVRTGLLILVAYSFFNFFYTLTVLTEGAHAERALGFYHHYLERKGEKVRNISRQEYYRHKAYEYRGFSGHFMIFHAVSTAVLFSALVLRGREEDSSI